MTKELDVNALNRVVQENLGEYHAAISSPANAQEAKLGLYSMEGLATLDQLDSARSTFCSVWPKARGFVKMAISVLGIFVPGASAAGAIVEAIEKQIIPIVCAKD